jgi:DNA-binding beta-propeller fold protein YncE
VSYLAALSRRRTAARCAREGGNPGRTDHFRGADLQGREVRYQRGGRHRLRDRRTGDGPRVRVARRPHDGGRRGYRLLTNHSRPIGTLTALDPHTGDIVGTAEIEDTAPEGAAADGKGHIFVNNEGKSTIQVIDVKTWKATNRVFSGCSGNSIVLDASTGKVVATIHNGTRVDALGWDASKKLIYIPNGGEGNVTVVHQDSADKYTVVATVATFPGAKTSPGRGGRARGPQGRVIAAWFIKMTE